ncbi:hypothetical protein [Thalassobius sp. Cn5-15]|uniref:hypothetical protein n=1 Tax=Thalassobius sp. Cn5-15 TaxID=2917763 RepID=UPI001EF18BA4|nr:hypothetical protein [Thalassobius sp. Cn5-15]MCG7493630.1 hypothetical protein [Thalassobius sp. Cn5-15]
MFWYIVLSFMALMVVVLRVRFGMTVLKGGFMVLAIPASIFFWIWLYNLVW